MNEQISWQVELRVKRGRHDAFHALTTEMVESTMSEAGAIIYERFIARGGDTIYVLERYSNSQSAIKHLDEFNKLYGKRFKDTVERKRFLVFGSPTKELEQILDRFGAEYFSKIAGFSRCRNSGKAKSAD